MSWESEPVRMSSKSRQKEILKDRALATRPSRKPAPKISGRPIESNPPLLATGLLKQVGRLPTQPVPYPGETNIARGSTRVSKN